MADFSHLDSLSLSLSNERSRMASAKSQGEIALRGVWVAQIEKEIRGERKYLGLGEETASNISTDDLLAELLA